MVQIEKKKERELIAYMQKKGAHELHAETFETIIYAIGRQPNTKNLGLEKLHVKLHESSNKIVVDKEDRSSVPNIFALGDCAHGRPELTPSAVFSGKLLANRLFGGSKILMDYINVPTTVFTPLEYGCVGYSEEAAKEKFGKDCIRTYHGNFKPLEWAFGNDSRANLCYIKMVCDISGADKQERVIGMHYLGPNAGEVIQGFAVAVKAKLSKQDFVSTVGIHPTCAEAALDLRYTTEEELPLNESCAGCGF